jgi:hypothetical protein
VSLASDLARIRATNVEKLRQVAERSMLVLSERIVSGSPVDSGAFRGNWIPGIDFQATDFSASYTGDSLGRISASLADIRIGATFYLVNNAPYAKRLEDGWSAQAGHGMVAINVREWDSIVSQQVQALK